MEGHPNAFIPKLHLGMHLVYRQRMQGSGNLYSNWLDESLNKVFKAACRHASQTTFETTVLTRMHFKLRELSGRSASASFGQ
jgi:hypothetical protein